MKMPPTKQNTAPTEEETQLKLLKLIESQGQETTQRDLARHLGISLGKTNYCLAGLIEKGYVRIQRFKNSKKKAAYAYILTPKGIKERARLTINFLIRKMREYERLKHEIAQLEEEVSNLTLTNPQN
jgi:EPS-associated MarR family transcriptional regulator